LQIYHAYAIPFGREGIQQHHPLNGVADCHAIGTESLKESQHPLHFYLRILTPRNLHMQGGLQVSIDGTYAWLPEGVVKGSPREGSCCTQMGAEVGGESETKDTLGLLIRLISGVLRQKVGSSGPYEPDNDTGGDPPQLLDLEEILHLLLPGAEIGTGEDGNSVDRVGRHLLFEDF
jgi:hypothetical protein